MNTVTVDAHVVAAAPSPAGPPVLETSICRRGALLRSALPFRTRIAMTANARTDGTNAVVTLERASRPHRFGRL